MGKYRLGDYMEAIPVLTRKNRIFKLRLAKFIDHFRRTEWVSVERWSQEATQAFNNHQIKEAKRIAKGSKVGPSEEKGKSDDDDPERVNFTIHLICSGNFANHHSLTISWSHKKLAYNIKFHHSGRGQMDRGKSPSIHDLVSPERDLEADTMLDIHSLIITDPDILFSICLAELRSTLLID